MPSGMPIAIGTPSRTATSATAGIDKMIPARLRLLFRLIDSLWERVAALAGRQLVQCGQQRRQGRRDRLPATENRWQELLAGADDVALHHVVEHRVDDQVLLADEVQHL